MKSFKLKAFACLFLLPALAVVQPGGSAFGKVVAGSGTIVNEKRMVEDFDAVQVRGQFIINIRIGDPKPVKLVADEKIIDLIDTFVKKRTLYIQFQDNEYELKHPVEVSITCRPVSSCRLSGSIQLSIEGLRETDFELKANGNCDVEISGAVDRFSSESAGKINLNAKQLKTGTSTITVKGKGTAEINADKSLHALIKGMGTITYWGDPENVRKEIKGIGSVKNGL